MIPIVKPYLPDSDKYKHYIDGIFARNYLTNNGPLLRELECKLAEYFDVPYLLLVSNGTIAIQVAMMALDVKSKVITTPFSFAATSSTLACQGITPIFADIDNNSLNIDVDSIDKQSLQEATAFLPVHVYGNVCNVEKIDKLAKQYDLKVIYDAAHTFGATYKGKSLMSYGDAATISLHATKIFHTVEGGAIAFKRKEDYLKAKQLINFGFNENNIPNLVGLNAKLSEIHAAMGLCLFDEVDNITEHRAALYDYYYQNLKSVVSFPQFNDDCLPNGAYVPILLNDEQELLALQSELLSHDIQTRRYFYPSLSEMKCYQGLGVTPVANDVCKRVLCLPMYYELTFEQVDDISQLVSSLLLSIRAT